MFRKVLALLFIVTLSVTLFGQVTEVERTGGWARLQGMGANPYITDPFFITVNPAWSSVYSDFIWGDLGGSAGNNFGAGGTGQFAAINVDVMDNLVLGGILSRADFNGVSIASLRPVNNLINTLQGFNVPTSPVINNNIELLGTFTVAKLSVGFGVSYGASKNEFNSAAANQSTESSAHQIGFNAGILTHTSRLALDAGVSLLLPGASFTPAQGNETKISQTILMVNGRIFLKLNDRLSLVPAVNFITESGSADIGIGNTTRSSDLPTLTMLGIGVGLNYRIGDFLLAGGPSFVTASFDTASVIPGGPMANVKSITLFPIWNLGFEWDIASWLTGRVGYIANTGSWTFNTAAANNKIDETITTFYGPVGATVGVGFHLGNFTLDATVNEDVLRQGLNNIGGGGATFAYLSLSYNFNE